MNIFLWVLQVLLAAHTAIGAVWKLSNPEQTVPSLSAIPHPVWVGLSVVEVVCAVGLILPVVVKSQGITVPVAAAVIAAEMLAYCGLHMASGESDPGSVTYWLVVAAICVFLAWARFALRPL